MSNSSVVITGVGCLTPFGNGVQEFVVGLNGRRPAYAVHALPDGCQQRNAVFGVLLDFSESLAGYAKPALRRKMSRISRMGVVAAGMAIDSAHLTADDFEQTGIAFGTAFGSTGQSETFFLDFLEHGPALVNPGLFPETVPNAPAGQISLTFGLQGPNLTVCQQHLSSELALQQAKDMLTSGMAVRMIVVGAEELSAPLLQGFDALGILKRETEFFQNAVSLSSRTMPSEAAIALVIETEAEAERREVPILAHLEKIVTHGEAAWPACYVKIGASLSESYSRLLTSLDQPPDLVVAGATLVDRVDCDHLHSLARLISAQTQVTMPELAIGSTMGAGLVRVLTGILALGNHHLPVKPLSKPLPRRINLAEFYERTAPAPATVMTSTVTPGGGAGLVLLAR